MRWVNFDRARIRTFISNRHRFDHRIPTLQCDAVVMAGGIFVAQLEGQNVEISQTDDWRGGCVAASVTSIRLGCIYLLGSFYILC
jgi:hypothetical protein